MVRFAAVDVLLRGGYAFRCAATAKSHEKLLKVFRWDLLRAQLR